MPLEALVQIGVACTLNILVIGLLIRGPLQRFPFVFLLCVAQLLITSWESFVSLQFGVKTKLYVQSYWTGDVVGHVCVWLIIGALMFNALAGNPIQRWVPIGMPAALLIFAAGTFLFYRSPHINAWMTSVTRNFSFGEEILNFILWALLLEKREYDRLLLMVSAGIGIQVTGEVIGHTLRIYASETIVWLPTFLVFVCEILCLLIWVAAFWKVENGQKPATVSGS